MIDTPPEQGEGGDGIIRAASILKAGGVVAFPTETSYGLAAAIDHEEALQRIFLIKKRSLGKPLLVLIPTIEMLRLVAEYIPEEAKPLIERYWPGPLTILFPARKDLPFAIRGNTGKVGVRISSHPVAQALVEAVGRPVTATSANISGRAPGCSAKEVASQLTSPSPDFILDSGRVCKDQCSTIVDVCVRPIRVTRKGAIDLEDILS